MTDFQPPDSAQVLRVPSTPMQVSVVGLWTDSGQRAGVEVARPRILVTKRGPGGHLAGSWELPGGKLEPGETPVQAALREVHEELGVIVERNALVPLVEVEHEYPDRRVRIHAFLARWPDATMDAPACEYAWIDVDALAEIALPAANGPISEAMRKWFARASG